MHTDATSVEWLELCRQDTGAAAEAAGPADATKGVRSGGAADASAFGYGLVPGAGPIATAAAAVLMADVGLSSVTQGCAAVEGQGAAAALSSGGALGRTAAAAADQAAPRTAVAPPPMQGIAPEDDDYDVE